MAIGKEWLVRQVERERLSDPRIVEAFRKIDRADFVPASDRRAAYDDRPVAIPEKQTTSQPTLIARMIAAAEPGADDVVLEIGTGYGFQTALLAHLCSRVYSIDRHEVLVETARANLERAGIENVEIAVGDGWLGYAKGAPYDAIIVSAAASSVPDPLVDQLVEGGRLVIPVRSPRSDDVLRFVKTDGALDEGYLVAPARFVPLVKEDDRPDVDYEW